MPTFYCKALCVQCLKDGSLWFGFTSYHQLQSPFWAFFQAYKELFPFLKSTCPNALFSAHEILKDGCVLIEC